MKRGRRAPYGKTDALGLSERDRSLLNAVRRMAAEVDERAATDPVAAERLCEQVLSILLTPGGRALPAHATTTIAGLFASRQRLGSRRGE